MTGVCMDITERREAEAQRNLLVAELSHRVKNTLAIVGSIARQTFSTNPDAKAAHRSFDARIRALAQTHTRLAEASWSGVSLKTVLFDELSPYHDDSRTNVTPCGPAGDAAAQACADTRHGGARACNQRRETWGTLRQERKSRYRVDDRRGK